MKILYAASEMVPYSKTGGLADVAGTLPDEIAAQGHEVVAVSPKYRVVTKGGFPLVDTGKKVGCYIGDKARPATMPNVLSSSRKASSTPQRPWDSSRISYTSTTGRPH